MEIDTMSDPQLTNQTIPLMCVLDAIPPDQRPRHAALWEALTAQRREVIPLDDGYKLTFPVEVLTQLAEFVSYERLCCPFFHFVIEIEPASDQIKLSLKGSGEIKAFLAQEMGILG